MADDWEQEDWEAEDFKPQLPASAGGKAAGADQYETAGQALLAKSTEPDMSKFEDEDQQEPEEETSYHIKPQVCHSSTSTKQYWTLDVSSCMHVALCCQPSLPQLYSFQQTKALQISSIL